MVLYDVTIFTYKKSYYVSGRPRSLGISVVSEVQYDKLSKRFNKFKHVLNYTESNYKHSDYNIAVYDNDAFFYRYILKYHWPQPKVTSVELYFKSNDPNNTHPLVVGITQENRKPIYYTYNFLIGHTTPKLYYNATYTTLPDVSNSFDSDDLIIRLIQENDLALKKNNGDKLVVRLDAKQTNEGKSNTYPKTGPNKDKITLLKSTYHDYFDKFEHKIDSQLNVSSFYLCYNNDSLFVDGFGRFKNLTGVEVYYNRYYGKKPIIIVLKSKTEDKLYKYSNLDEDFVYSNKAKKFTSLEKIDEAGLYFTLKSINNDVNKNLLYLIEHKTPYCYRIKVTNEKIILNDGFTKYTHTPENDYKSNSSSVTYNGNSLLERKDGKVEEIKDLKDQKFHSISVFFGTKNENIPLLVKICKSYNTFEFYSHNKDDGSYWEKINEGFSDTDTQKCNKKLKEIESNLFESICIVVNNQTKYSKDEINGKTITKLSDSQPMEICVTTSSDITCLENTNYKCYEHKLHLADSEPQHSSNDSVKLRLFVATNSDKFSEIILYNNDELSEFNKEYIYYKKSDLSSSNKFYVIFYHENEKRDPRPLLLCYQDKIYKPFSLKDYGSKWVCVHGVKLISDTSENPQLFETLKNVSYLLNRVDVGQFLDKKSVSVKKYDIQEFNSTKIEVNIRSEDLNCYRKYTHTPNTGYILGEISHNGTKLFDNYNRYMESTSKNGIFPNSVTAYYYLYDNGHLHPLIIALTFGSADVRYYKLRSKDNSLKWELISDGYELSLANDSKIEQLLYNIRYNLGIPYENKPENLIMRSADKCNERSNVGVIAGVLSTIALVSGGAAGAVYKFPEFFRSIYSRIN